MCRQTDIRTWCDYQEHYYGEILKTTFFVCDVARKAGEVDWMIESCENCEHKTIRAETQEATPRCPECEQALSRELALNLQRQSFDDMEDEREWELDRLSRKLDERGLETDDRERQLDQREYDLDQLELLLDEQKKELDERKRLLDVRQ